MKKYFYFRTVAAVGNDDASGDSILVDVDNLCGFQGASDTTVVVYFNSINNSYSLTIRFFI